MESNARITENEEVIGPCLLPPGLIRLSRHKFDILDMNFRDICQDGSEASRMICSEAYAFKISSHASLMSLHYLIL